MNQCYYAVLNVTSTASQTQLKQAYHKLARRYHPDKHPEDPVRAHKEFQQINRVYSTLSDPVRRTQYDICHKLGLCFREEAKTTFQQLLAELQARIQETYTKSTETLVKRARTEEVSLASDGESDYDEEKAYAWLFST